MIRADGHRALGEFILQLASDHEFDHLLAGKLANRTFADICAIAQHGHSIRDRKYFIEPVADINDADGVPAEVADDVEEALDFARAMLGTPVPPAVLRSLGPDAATRALYRLAWPPANVRALRGHMRRRAVQIVTSESWRGMLTSAVFMGRRRERIRLFARHMSTGASAS